ncbi:MAG: hypothetical protein Q9167_004745 [Letrouitia subvulpina]
MTVGETLLSFTLLVFTLLGFFVVASRLLSFVRLLLSLFVLPGTSLRTFGPPSSWAIVTGASDGLGKEFALQLARQKFNLLLVSRTQSKLETLEQEIASRYPGVKTHVLAMDFAADRDPDYAKLKQAIERIGDDGGIAILVNNVGKSHDIPVPFTQTPDAEMRDIVTINCLATLRVTALVAPAMARRGRGLILTMGSFGGLFPTPLLATYSGSKAFLQHWSTALAAEMRPRGVQVQLVQSYLVTSAMSKIKRPSAAVPSARAFVRSVLASVGRSGGAQEWGWSSTPWWSHAVAQWFVAGTVGLTGKWVVRINQRMHEGIRSRALRKRERDAKKGL